MNVDNARYLVNGLTLILFLWKQLRFEYSNKKPVKRIVTNVKWF